jgi:hypothetical protein
MTDVMDKRQKIFPNYASNLLVIKLSCSLKV